MSAALLAQCLPSWRAAHCDEAATRPSIYAAKIRSQYQQIPMILTVDLVNAGLAAAVTAGHVNNARSAAFFASVAALAILRAAAWALYRARPSMASDRQWAVAATMGSCVSGVLWGLAGALLPTSLVEQTFFAFVIGVMCAAPLVSFSYYFPAFIGYLVPATLPLAGRFFLQGWSVDTAMGDMVVVFAVSTALAAYNSNRSFTKLLRLNFVLANRTGELSEANAKLDAEIKRRGTAEDQLRQAQKMEAIGQLTGGIAHDFNNLLTGVLGHLEMAYKRVGDDPRTAALLCAARHAAERGATLTRHLLAFARRQHLDPRAVDIRTAIGCVEPILRQTIGPDIRIHIDVEPGTAFAWVDPGGFELALLNLALNARDAMPDGGVITIRAENRREETGAAGRELTLGDYILVSVSDTGTGMTEEVLARAFEPFFTTKEAGRGSGLGLSMVHGFAAQSGGTVQLVSVCGRGTRVDLWLPGAAAGAAELPPVEENAAAESATGARILVCDDDDDVRSFVVDILRDGGFAVWEADKPSAALRLLEQAHPIDLLLADYALPEMKGPALIERARARQPGLKALIMTGYAEALQGGEAGGLPLIAKPFRAAELGARIGDILAAAPSGASPAEPRLRPNGRPLEYRSPRDTAPYPEAAAAAGN